MDNSPLKIHTGTMTDSSDDDIPLSAFKTLNHSAKLPMENNFVEEFKLGRNRINGNKVKLKEPKNKTRKQGIVSGSESSNFEKYQYFDKNRTKKRIKLSRDFSTADLQNEIDQIKQENSCLKREYKRIYNIKIMERLKLHEEIKRLKNIVVDLKLGNYFANKTILQIGNTTNLIKNLKENLETLDYTSMSNNIDIAEKLNAVSLTGLEFWEDFNLTKTNSEGINSEPFWVGDLNNINPDSNKYFIPYKYLEKSINKHDKNDNMNDKVEKNVSTGIKNSEHRQDHYSDESNSGRMNGDDSRDSTQKKITNFKNDEPCNSNLKYDEPNSQTEDNNLDSTSETLEESDEGICTECGHESSWTSFVARHREAYKNGIKLPPCDTCNQKFLKSGHFNGKHRLRKSPSKRDSPNFMCEKCGVKCSTLSGLSQHKLRHGKARYLCAHCPHKCRRRASMKVHVETHFRSPPENDSTTGMNAYGCDSCSDKFKSRRALKLHLESHPKRKRSFGGVRQRLPFKLDPQTRSPETCA